MTIVQPLGKKKVSSAERLETTIDALIFLKIAEITKSTRSDLLQAIRANIDKLDFVVFFVLLFRSCS